MFDFHPFKPANVTNKKYEQAVLNRELELPNKVQIPHSDEFADFVSRLLEKTPNERLGKSGDYEVRNHPWFKDYTYIDYQDNETEITLPAIDFEALQNR